jgi:hypothetical protein
MVRLDDASSKGARRSIAGGKPTGLRRGARLRADQGALGVSRRGGFLGARHRAHRGEACRGAPIATPSSWKAQVTTCRRTLPTRSSQRSETGDRQAALPTRRALVDDCALETSLSGPFLRRPADCTCRGWEALFWSGTVRGSNPGAGSSAKASASVPPMTYPSISSRIWAALPPTRPSRSGCPCPR